MKTIARTDLGLPLATTGGNVHIPAASLHGDGIVILTAPQARRLAYELLARAEQAAAESATSAE